MGASMAQSRLKTIEKLETSGIEAPKVRRLFVWLFVCLFVCLEVYRVFVC